MSRDDHDDSGQTASLGNNAGSGSLASLLGLLADHDTQVFATHFTSLNNSGATGDALLFLNDNALTVAIHANGLEADSVHPQHIHGLLGGDDSSTPTIAQDADRDGFVELAEGLETYGPVLLNLTTNPETATQVAIGSAGHSELMFPTADEDGNLVYSQTFTFDPDSEIAADILDELNPLENREIVLHGLTLAEGQGGVGGPAPDEADGTAGYKTILPVASGEIHELTSPIETFVAATNFLCDENGNTCLDPDFFFIA